MLRFIVVVAGFMFFGSLFGSGEHVIIGQEEGTATPAPSKTPSPSSTPEPTVTEVSEVFEPFTQSDLTVLVGNVQRPNGIVWYNDKLYTSCNGDWTIYEIDDTDGSTRTYIYGVRNVHAMVVEPISDTEIDLWVPDFDTNSLLKINRNRSPQTVASLLSGPWGIDVFDEDRFLVTNLSSNSLNLISREGSSVEVVDQLRSPTGVVVTEDTVFVANNGSARRSIEWIEKDALIEDETPTLNPLVNGLQNTTGLVMASDGKLYFSYALGTRGVVGRVDPVVCEAEENGCSNDQIEIVLYTELAAPLAGLAISDDMRLFVHTIFRPEIYWVSLDEEQRN